MNEQSHVKQVHGTRVLDVINCISTNGESPFIMRRLGLKKNSLWNHLRKARVLGLIEQTQSHPYGVYKLTSKGVQVHKIFIHSDTKYTLYRCHDLIIGFPIISFGQFSFLENTRRKVISMNGGWKYATEKENGLNIHIQDNNLLKVYCRNVYSSCPDEAFAKMTAEATSIAQKYCDKYDMKFELDHLRVIRKGHKSLVNSEKFAKLLGKVNLGDVWIDESNGSGELEASQDNYGLEDLLKVPKAIAQITPIIIQQQQINAEFSKQLALHLQVLTDMKDTMKAIRDEVHKLR